MTLQTTRLSVWFRSQIHQQQHQSQSLLTSTRHFNPLTFFGFGRPALKTYSKTGRAVILDETSLSKDDDGDDQNTTTFNVDLNIENNHSTQYNPLKDIIIKNYSSTLTFSETEAMAISQKLKKNKSGVIGQTFAGIIEHIPSEIKQQKSSSFPFEVGDRVWGVSPSIFGHCWSDYVPVPYKSVSHAPMNIPLHFCGLYPLQLHGLNSILKYAKLSSFESMKNLSVLFIGTGRRSMFNVFAPLLKHLDEKNKVVIIDDDKQCRFDENTLINELGMDCFYKMDAMNECMEQYKNSFDIVFDAMASDKNEILENCAFVKAKGVYFWRQNHMAQSGKNMTFKGVFEGARFLTDIQHSVKKQHNGVQFVPNMDVMVKDGTVLDRFSSYFAEMQFPIILDKMYDLDDVQSAFDYALNNDDGTLGENIGILIEEEKDSESVDFEGECKPKMIELPSIESRNNEKKEGEHRKYNVESEGFGFEESKTQKFESQTIAKETSNKS